MTFTDLGWIVLAGGIGALVRYGAEKGSATFIHHSRHWATMGVNVVGCFLSGLLATYLAAHNSVVSHHLSVFTTGFCGGLTTFSSALAFPHLQWKRGHHVAALVNLLGTPLLCAAAFMASLQIH